MSRLKSDPKLVKEYQSEIGSIANSAYVTLVSLSAIMQRAKQDYHEEFLNRSEYQQLKSECMSVIRDIKNDLKEIPKL